MEGALNELLWSTLYSAAPYPPSGSRRMVQFGKVACPWKEGSCQLLAKIAQFPFDKMEALLGAVALKL